MYGFTCTYTTVFIVANDAPKQSVVGGGYVVVRVEQNGGECRSIDAILELLGNMSGQLRVECVDSFHDEYFVLLELQSLAVAFLTDTSLEIVFGQCHFFTIEKLLQLLVEQIDVECIKAFVVIFSVCIAWGPFAVYEIVVERHHHRLDATSHQLDGQTFAEGGFPTR